MMDNFVTNKCNPELFCSHRTSYLENHQMSIKLIEGSCMIMEGYVMDQYLVRQKVMEGH